MTKTRKQRKAMVKRSKIQLAVRHLELRHLIAKAVQSNLSDAKLHIVVYKNRIETCKNTIERHQSIIKRHT